MAKYLRRNLSIKIISILAAVFLWLYVTNEQAPTEQATKTVKLEVQQLKPELLIAEKPDTVKVRIQGTKSAFSSLTDKDIVAFVDLSDVKPGNNEVVVQVKTPGGIKVLETTPFRVTVIIDSIVEKRVPVKIKLTGNPASGYVLATPVFNPTFVTLKGPGRYLKQLENGFVDLELSGTQQNINISLPVRLSAKNIDTGAIEVNPREIKVTVPVTKDMVSKSIPLKSNITGTPGEDFQLGPVTINPDKITVQGARDIINGLNSLNLENIDITGIKSDLQKDVKIILPDGVKTQNGNTVKVSIKVVAKPGSKPTQ